MIRVKNLFLNVLLVILIILFAGIVVPKLIWNVEYKAVLSGSMEPELSVGSLVVVKPTKYQDIKIGDNITYVLNENLTLVTHKVINKDDANRKIQTKGIANKMADGYVLYENVVGKVIFHVPYLGYFLSWLSTLKGKIISISVIVMLFAISLLFGSSDKKKDKKESALIEGIESETLTEDEQSN